MQFSVMIVSLALNHQCMPFVIKWRLSSRKFCLYDHANMHNYWLELNNYFVLDSPYTNEGYAL